MLMLMKKDSFQLSKYTDALVLCEQGIPVLEEYWRCVQRYAENEYLLNLKLNTYISGIVDRIQNKEKVIDDLKNNIVLTDDELADYGIYMPIAPKEPLEVRNCPPEMPVMQKSNIFSREKTEREYAEALQEYDAAVIQYEKILKDYEYELQQYHSEMEKYKNSVRELTEKRR